MSGATPELNKTSIRRFVERALNRGDLQVVDATRGAFAEAGKRRIQELRSAFPDLITTIHPIVAEGDWVAHRMVHTGTHLGPFRGIPSTGHRVRFTSIAMNRFHDGIVVENWGLHDIPTLLQQIQTVEHWLRFPRTSIQETSQRDFRGRARELAAGFGGAPNVLVGGQPVQTAPASSATSTADELAKLADLRDRGVLTDQEFQEQKRRLLGQ